MVKEFLMMATEGNDGDLRIICIPLDMILHDRTAVKVNADAIRWINHVIRKDQANPMILAANNREPPKNILFTQLCKEELDSIGNVKAKRIYFSRLCYTDEHAYKVMTDAEFLFGQMRLSFKVPYQALVGDFYNCHLHVMNAAVGYPQFKNIEHLIDAYSIGSKAGYEWHIEEFRNTGVVPVKVNQPLFVTTELITINDKL